MVWIGSRNSPLDFLDADPLCVKQPRQYPLDDPRWALGCSRPNHPANVSSTSWDLRVPKVPFIGEEQAGIRILRPDGPIREARHHLHHLLSAARGEIIILDPSKDNHSGSRTD